MGAWGSGSFENDGALDWVIELEAADDIGFCGKRWRLSSTGTV
jgi:hypothetical protein